MDRFERHFAPRPQTVPSARHALSRWLDHRELRPETRGDVLLVVSELVSNGVLHDGGDDLIVRAWAEDGSIRIEVVSRAASVAGPDPRGVESVDFGRGLAIVNYLGQYSMASNGPRRVDRCRIPA
jgi:anti-sigma regulatory factor (Ser/Thr protein kinase)